MPNYAVFHVNQSLAIFYTLYYYGWLIVTIMLALIWSLKSVNKRQLWALSAGYSVFIIPTTLVNIINPSTTAGIPSIMCGFAVLLAVAVVIAVLPRTAKPRIKGTL